MKANSLHAAIVWHAGVPGLHMNVSSNCFSMQLNELYQNTSICGTLKDNANQAEDTAVMIIVVHIDHATVLKIIDISLGLTV